MLLDMDIKKQTPKSLDDVLKAATVWNSRTVEGDHDSEDSDLCTTCRLIREQYTIEG